MFPTVVLTAMVLLRLADEALSDDCGSARRLVSSSEVAPIILDDADVAGKGWSAGDLSSCLEDAYHHTFHHDRSMHKRHVSGIYTFNPPKDGCYVVEEHHPGQNEQCSKYLPTNARVVVDYCKGKSAYTYVDQSIRGGQWNLVGALPFYVGWQGRIRVANNGTDSTCRLGSDCLWVADAFKVTWVSDLSKGCKIPDDYESKAPAATAASSPAETTTTTGEVSKQTVVSTKSIESNMNIVHQALDPIQTVIDDVSVNASISWQRSSCGVQVQGWLQSFLFNRRSKTTGHSLSGYSPQTPAEFKFDPRSDGCYLVEEFHPENMCGEKLSADVSLTVHYCKGLKYEAHVDQSKEGNRWNTIGTFPFYKGVTGKILVKHATAGVAAADAFRFTRISSSCHDAVQASIHYQRLAQNAAAILVDNRYPLQGQQNVCHNKALGGSLHAASFGEAEAKFEFVPTSTGCYRIDSFHPEQGDEESCPLADHATLEVNWCLGRQTTLMAPLRGKGNQWNTVGHFKFFAGTKGSVISRRPSQTPKGKFWIADAFRFTKVSEGCNAIPEVAHVTFHITGKELDGHLPAVLETGITSYPDMRMALREAVAEATQLPYKSIQLLSLRRGSVIADFEVHGHQKLLADSVHSIATQMLPGAKSTLKQSLCNAVTSKAEEHCDVTLKQLKVVGAPHGTEEEALPDDSNDNIDASTLTVTGVAGAGTLLFALATGCLLWHRCKKNGSSISSKEGVSPKEADPEVMEGKISLEESYPDGEKGTPACDECSLSGSTVTPTSDHNEELRSVSDMGHIESRDPVELGNIDVEVEV